ATTYITPYTTTPMLEKEATLLTNPNSTRHPPVRANCALQLAGAIARWSRASTVHLLTTPTLITLAAPEREQFAPRDGSAAQNGYLIMPSTKGTSKHFSCMIGPCPK